MRPVDPFSGFFGFFWGGGWSEMVPRTRTDLDGPDFIRFGGIWAHFGPNSLPDLPCGARRPWDPRDPGPVGLWDTLGPWDPRDPRDSGTVGPWDLSLGPIGLSPGPCLGPALGLALHAPRARSPWAMAPWALSSLAHLDSARLVPSRHKWSMPGLGTSCPLVRWSIPRMVSASAQRAQSSTARFQKWFPPWRDVLRRQALSVPHKPLGPTRDLPGDCYYTDGGRVPRAR